MNDNNENQAALSPELDDIFSPLEAGLLGQISSVAQFKLRARKKESDGETGFLFDRPSTESFLGGVRRAFTAFKAKDRLDAMRRSAMSRSFSWDISAACYSALYRKTLSS